MADRSLDQQCTVTRPGLAFIASGLAVEVLVAILHSEKKNRESAEEMMIDCDKNEINDRIPHQVGVFPHRLLFYNTFARRLYSNRSLPPLLSKIRGFLRSFECVYPCTPRFPQCTACGDAVVDAYRANPSEFIRQVCSIEGPELLTRLSGLMKLMDFSDDDLSFGDSDDDDNDI